MPTPPRRRRWPLRAGLAAAAAGLVAVGALALVGGADSQESGLPTLPPIDEREPGAFDDEGCVRVEDECTLQADELDAVTAGEPGDAFRTLEGFSGPRYTTDLARGAVVVLDDTVRAGADADGAWTAVGVARNETAEAVGTVAVTARLLDAAGAELEVLTADSLVAPVRPGEPTPFRLAAEVAAEQVATVEWSATAEAPSGAVEVARAAEITTYWSEPAGEREPVEVAGHVDPDGPKPHLVFGSLTGLDGADLAAPTVVAAWYGEDGRLLAVAEAEATSLAEPGEALDHLAAGTIADFLLVVDDGDGADAAALAAAELSLWAVGS